MPRTADARASHLACASISLMCKCGSTCEIPFYNDDCCAEPKAPTGNACASVPPCSRLLIACTYCCTEPLGSLHVPEKSCWLDQLLVVAIRLIATFCTLASKGRAKHRRAGHCGPCDWASFRKNLPDKRCSNTTEFGLFRTSCHPEPKSTSIATNCEMWQCNCGNPTWRLCCKKIQTFPISIHHALGWHSTLGFECSRLAVQTRPSWHPRYSPVCISLRLSTRLSPTTFDHGSTPGQ